VTGLYYVKCMHTDYTRANSCTSVSDACRTNTKLVNHSFTIDNHMHHFLVEDVLKFFVIKSSISVDSKCDV